MTLTLDETLRAADDVGARGETVTMLQNAAAIGHRVMFPGTLESRPSAAPAEEPTRPAGGYVHGTAPPAADHTGPIGRTIIWLVDRLIALMRTAPAR